MSKLTDKEIQDQTAALCRGCEALYTQQELQERLKAAADENRQLRVKLGLDPTTPDIHLGHTIVLRKVLQFQDFGHRAVIIIGDYTARIGDPSGVNKTRPVLSAEQIETNAATYVEQAAKVLDTSAEKLEIRRNSEWLDGLKLADLLGLASQITVARMMDRDTFRKRFGAEVPIGVHEFIYPLMQGYDSVCIQADVELGGNDQTFNNLVGRDIQRAHGQQPQIVMIMPILVGLDGVEKMSKSKGNYVGITDEPNEMFGKVMSIPDEVMTGYFELLTELPREKIDELMDAESTHPREAKAALAKMIVERYYGPSSAEAAAAEFDRVFSQREAPSEMPRIRLSCNSMNIVELIVKADFAKSNSQARRLISQNAVSIDGRKITDTDAQVELEDGAVLRVGRRRFGRITLR
ncbi:MAG: tyrosine--tRNA ligase [Planctomycetota bacterium]|jgi:tyrosyl-tRNA synthetase